ncbi:contact-dependent growth inhibition system immunity protein [Hymenobacter latericus]|uniref:contact-dependent growth inhibition system immunity protein n=1 Tax=Hymenobacter sp. YIM 151858-1 TaxID=2987688 RepID=UPI002226586A|nr:contact-dependent growth inhibition system immunity protein [Hymenobacter sp. YIM 151858-1]UYZ57599.1 contact-dependent growth inhibition system immunity protein [Hymenobacter sp. YIM 151858-1]
MKLERNWRNKSLDNLEKEVWGASSCGSNLTNRVVALRKMPLEQLRAEDLRLLIRQGISLPYLVPLVLELLEQDVAVETDYGPGNLLETVLKIDEQYWFRNQSQWSVLCKLVSQNSDLLVELAIDTTKFLRVGKQLG